MWTPRTLFHFFQSSSFLSFRGLSSFTDQCWSSLPLVVNILKTVGVGLHHTGTRYGHVCMRNWSDLIKDVSQSYEVWSGLEDTKGPECTWKWGVWAWGECPGLYDVYIFFKSRKWEIKRLVYTGLIVELEHLKTKTRLIDEKFSSGLCVLEVIGVPLLFIIIEKTWSKDKTYECNLVEKVKLKGICLSWINKARVKEKTFIWVSVWYKTKN